MSATANEIGRVIHFNDEIEYIMGYTKRDLLGLNVSKVMPAIVGNVHDKFLLRFLEVGNHKSF